MTNEQIISKMKDDMKMRGFSHWTEESYLGKTKDIMKYLKKPMEEVEIEELRNFLLKYLREERKLSERSVNYYNSVIRFIYEVTMDKIINKKQLPMYRKRRKMKDVLTKEELSTFFNACENYMYKTIFMMIYGSGLRISEAVNLRIEDIDSRKMRIFVRAGKGGKDRYTVLPKNSCRNRHCPNCQTGKKLKWIEARKEEVLNIKYYHVVFTIPSEIYNIAIQNQEKIYKILFKASAETLQELAKDEKYLGGEIGFFSILHTWGQNLMYHPHIHCVVTGGGLTELEKWVEKEEEFFIPVKVMSRKFRGKFLSYVRETKLKFYGKNKEIENPAIYNELVNQMYNKEWIVYCKEPFQNANSVIQYLGRYTHRVAISNERIVKIEDGKVTSKWRDYKNKNKMKEMTVTIEEFYTDFKINKIYLLTTL